MVEMNEHGEWPNDLDYIVELQSQLAEVTEERDEAWKTVHEYSLHAFAHMSKEQQADIMKVFKELAGE